MKKISFLLAASLCTSISFSQFKIDNFGHIGLGTSYPNSGYQAHIIKNLLVSNPVGTTFSQLQINVIGASSGSTASPTISSSTNTINFINPTYLNWQDLGAANYYKYSDSTLKTNIRNLDCGLQDILKIRPVSYTVKKTSFVDDKTPRNSFVTEYGFISQEIKNAFPKTDITQDASGFLLMDYDQIIPVLVKAVQEQQQIINDLRMKLDDLSTGEANSLSSPKTENTNSNRLYQNQPNPFSEQTVIRFKISEDSRQASIVIFNLLGETQKTYLINEKSDQSITVNAFDLKPGKYLYSLIFDGVEVDSKSMILLAN